ncbi:uncharacterized protein TRIADDRAFT_54930 [Trichoplax adhaerens]|uniref:Amine oxidase domain-containing protein n=1 Tax=Trichoplax adhaerens TaxID=10228 RepID=B3RTE0_TRIAD|nr:hypothetical protein TRIADDRAFT_54930 [Trichoplax adhaerens]EDV27209.1 hypothetical protein TRIADDRAFT_54930 [Trichoplax adhaerens]|eukprot:XP_002111205.1 hypothetical protein TRIADDRAFT_54930 [Trichoplax adhaerens]
MTAVLKCQSTCHTLYFTVAISTIIANAVQKLAKAIAKSTYNVDADYLAGPEPVLYNVENSPPGKHWEGYDKYQFTKEQCKGSTKKFNTFVKESHTEDSRFRECLLRIVRNKSNMKKVTRKVRIGIVGAGMSGLVAGYELKRLGYDIAILEATQRIGGRAKTFRSEIFSDHLHGEAGPMRFPPSHYLTFAYLQEMGLSWNSFTTAGPESLYYFTSKDGRSRPYPKKIFNWKTKDYRHDVVMKLCADFNVESKECIWPVKRFEDAMKSQIKELELCGWEHMMQKYDQYSTRTFLESLMWSKNYITFLSVVINQENFLDIGFIEYFKDYVGQFWSDNAYYSYPKNDSDNLYRGLPRSHLHQVMNGTDALPSAFYKHLKDNLIFGALVRSIKQSDSLATVEYTVQNSYKKKLTFDFVLITLPFTVLRDVLTDPPFSPAKRQSIREFHYISATKILLQFRKAFWVKPNPLVAAEFNQTGIINGGGSTTDLPLRAIYYPTGSVKYDQRAVLLAAYTWEAEADRWGSLDENCRLRRALEYVAKMHGDQAYDLFETGTSQVWKNQPYTGAAVSYFYPQQRELLFRNSYSRERRCFFAGEHTSFTHFWIQGAIQSALRAVIQIYQASSVDSKAADPVSRKEYYPDKKRDYIQLKPSKGIEQKILCKEDVMSIHQSMAVKAREYGENTRFSVMVNILKGNIYAEINGQAARLDSGATLFIPQGSTYMITANTTTQLLKYSPSNNEICQQVQQKSIAFKMHSKHHHATLYFTDGNASNLNKTGYLFGIASLNKFLKGYTMSIQQRNVAHVADGIVTNDKLMPSMIAFLSSQSKRTFTAQMKTSQRESSDTFKEVMSNIEEFNSNSPFCFRGSTSFSSLEAVDIDQRPMIKHNVKAIVSGCYVDFKKLQSNQQPDLGKLWHSISGKGESSFILAAESKTGVLTEKVIIV